MISGQTITGGSFGPYFTFGSANVFIGVTFQAPVYFGDGNTFVNCSFVRCCYPYYTNPYSEAGNGATVTNTILDYVNFGEGGMFQNCVLIACDLGTNYQFNGPGQSEGGGQSFSNDNCYCPTYVIAKDEKVITPDICKTRCDDEPTEY